MISMGGSGYSLEGCCFHYPVSGAGLSDISFNFLPGKMYGLIGPNGSGKTTLIDLLTATRTTASGRILLDGRPIGDYPKRELARQIALVPQSFAMEFDFTVFEVVMMGRHPYIPRFADPSPADIAMVKAALDILDIAHLGGRPLPQLSGGERQRVIVARALAQDTAILLLDEATASLDIRHSIDIMSALRRRVTTGGATIIAAIHDLDLAAAFCDELLVLKDGRINACGPVEKVLTPELLREVFAVEAEVQRSVGYFPHIQYRYRNAQQS